MISEITAKDIFRRVALQKEIFKDINKELKRQDDIWGAQNHSFAEWIAILGEEFGEVCKEVSEMRMADGLEKIVDLRANLDEEIIQVVAVCFRILDKIRSQNASR